MSPPTARQLDVLRFIAAVCSLGNGAGPTLRQICNRMRIGSTAGAAWHTSALRRKGLVTWSPRCPGTLRPTARGFHLVSSEVASHTLVELTRCSRCDADAFGEHPAELCERLAALREVA